MGVSQIIGNEWENIVPNEALNGLLNYCSSGKSEWIQVCTRYAWTERCIGKKEVKRKGKEDQKVKM
jgi:hypothetical protein